MLNGNFIAFNRLANCLSHHKDIYYSEDTQVLMSTHTYGERDSKINGATTTFVVEYHPLCTKTLQLEVRKGNVPPLQLSIIGGDLYLNMAWTTSINQQHKPVLSGGQIMLLGICIYPITFPEQTWEWMPSYYHLN